MSPSVSLRWDFRCSRCDRMQRTWNAAWRFGRIRRRSQARRRAMKWNSVGGDRVELADTHKRAPRRRKTGAGQDVERIVAERAAVSAHVGAEAADLVMAGGIEHAGKDNQYCSHKIHLTPPCRHSNVATSHRGTACILGHASSSRLEASGSIFGKFMRKNRAISRQTGTLRGISNLPVVFACYSTVKDQH